MSNDYRAYVECDYNSIYHHGIKGMKWGVRRFQNEDGSLTPEGRARYAVEKKKHEDGAANLIRNREHIKNFNLDDFDPRTQKEYLKQVKAFEKKVDVMYKKAYKKAKAVEKEADKLRDNYCKKHTGMTWEELDEEAYSGRHPNYDEIWEHLNTSEDMWNEYTNPRIDKIYKEAEKARDTLELLKQTR